MKLYAIVVTWEWDTTDSTMDTEASVLWVGSDWEEAKNALGSALEEEKKTLNVKEGTFSWTNYGSTKKRVTGKSWSGTPVTITARLQTLYENHLAIRIGGAA